MAPIPLDTPLDAMPGIGPRVREGLARLSLTAVRDLLWHFPFRYEDFSEVFAIDDLEPGQQATVSGVVQEIDVRRTWKKHMILVEAYIADDTGTVKALWFNQPYIKNILQPGRKVNISGRVAISDNEIYLNNPTYEVITGDEEEFTATHTGRLVPIYPETRGLTSKGIRAVIAPLIQGMEDIPEWIPGGILSSQGLPDATQAIRAMHFPESPEEASAARRRFAFEDLYLLQIATLQQKKRLAKEKAPLIPINTARIQNLISSLPFSLTKSQTDSLWEILKDMAKGSPMNRLLQGDVGSGKTIVALLAAFAACDSGVQVAIMAPTEILARQHYETLKKLAQNKSGANPLSAAHLPIGFTSASQSQIFYDADLETEISKARFKEKAKSGEIKIVIGTHALIGTESADGKKKKDAGVPFKKLGLVVIDEQHRFGVRQRAALLRGQTQTKKQTDADEKLLFEDLTYAIRGCALSSKEKLGLGHKELIYQRALAKEFELKKMKFEAEKKIPVMFEGEKIGTYQPDFVVDEKVVVELKALPFIGKNEEKQLWTYMKGSPYKIGLLINFGGSGVEFRRVIYDSARSAHMSAQSPRESAIIPHLLSMSATPIPRTVMLTVFGDLDVSTITELPAGRRDIVTKAIDADNRTKAYGFIKGALLKGRQAFVICPRIDPDTKEDAGQLQIGGDIEEKSAKEEFDKLSKRIFPEFSVGILHGQMSAKEKDATMENFREGKIQILVSTSVVEVGVDVPNATIMMIEGADKFGLAQLYQFRGRVGRGEHQSFCFLFSDMQSDAVQERLSAVVSAKNGFDLAERDLEIRGPGEFIGERQTGIPDSLMKGIQNIRFIKACRDAAAATLEEDPALSAWPLLKERVSEFAKKLHQE